MKNLCEHKETGSWVLTSGRVTVWLDLEEAAAVRGVVRSDIGDPEVTSRREPGSWEKAVVRFEFECAQLAEGAMDQDRQQLLLGSSASQAGRKAGKNLSGEDVDGEGVAIRTQTGGLESVKCLFRLADSRVAGLVKGRWCGGRFLLSWGHSCNGSFYRWLYLAYPICATTCLPLLSAQRCDRGC